MSTQVMEKQTHDGVVPASNGKSNGRHSNEQTNGHGAKGQGYNPAAAFSKVTGEDSLTMDDLGFLLMGHSAFQYLNAGCTLGLFELLNERPNSSTDEIMEELELQYRATRSLLLGCTSLKLVIKDGDSYRNAAAIEQLFTDKQWKIYYDTVQFEAQICYDGQTDLVESLRQNTNVGLRRVPGQGPDLYHRYAEDPKLQEVFYNYMGSWSELSNPLLVDNVDFSNVRRILDIGGGDATNAIAVAKANPHLHVTLLDLPDNSEVARRKIAENGLADRIDIYEADMFQDEFPTGYDCLMFVHQLVIWPTETNAKLIQRAYDALTPGGKIIIFSSMSNDTEDGPVFAALDTVYFLCTPAEGGMIYPWKDYEHAMQRAGFKNFQRFAAQSWTPHGVIVGTK